MKKVVEYLMEQGILCRSMKQIEPKELGSRKRAEIYLGVDRKNYYCIIIYLSKKSRILKKEADELIGLEKKAEKYNRSRILKKYLLADAPICSKASAHLEESGWKVFRLAN
jgi:hypothetical protein